MGHGVAAALVVPAGSALCQHRVAAVGDRRVADASAGSRRRLDRDARFPRARGTAIPRSLEGAQPPMTGREAFLERVRQATAAGTRAGTSAPLPERGNLGYQGAG